MEDLETLRAELMSAVEAASDPAALEEVRVSALGKKGRVTALMKALGGMDPEQRKAFGQEMNRVKAAVAEAIDQRRAALEAAALDARLERERIDVTLPVRPESTGSIHPISQTWDEVVAIFAQMGFAIAEGPDIEDDFHNFTALNFPPDHPAREMHDTFFLPERADGTRHVLRTHTSPVQIRTLLGQKPPVRVLAPGRTYRSDSDMTHTPMFHQFEGLVIDQSTHMGHLKGCLQEFVEAYFEVDNVPMRFRPSFFPFTEPSAEVDIGCSRKGGELRIGAGDDWLEILGCGMVHPNVLRACGLDPAEYQGFAFGMGLERIAMLKYGIPDLRTFFESDLRWLRHYGFGALDVPTLHGGLGR
ncbi:phenylalanine--tRNA ligase subunit alpha [Roseospira marina]|uniref:Phenylalanine--tRNA ligase alpha subunit n=1 Tax=Roseospira marina TaxID=140057 RepID=A0A5M6I7H1_9PROT|nr:phenylalanine--tRNA ligase subunit alpha [Roseospira marina]KAA5604211.1 phenylalanine--tRNA ligase subunit alpha [Roseospira marina]MBB4315691.1 phenylalanyl-tRNA synthetase alpha chain [Roseospira marina]MBB5088803.1 phenylalanyl-tRNA synthetase alpha chain [Roseospira marina]